MKQGKKIYFASDFHLGVPNHAKSLEREKKFVDGWIVSARTLKKFILLAISLIFGLNTDTLFQKDFPDYLESFVKWQIQALNYTSFMAIMICGNSDIWKRKSAARFTREKFKQNSTARNFTFITEMA